MSYYQYENDKKRGYLRTLNRGGYGREVLIEWDTLRGDRKEAIEAALGNPYGLVQKARLEDYIKPDPKAAAYYASYRLPDGRELKDEYQRRHLSEACIIRALIQYIDDTTRKRKAMNMRKGEVWNMAAHLVAELDVSRYPHKLPTNPRRLKEAVRRFQENGYESLIHGNWCNRNSRKVNELVERLLISIYCMDNLPFGDWVHDYYLKFIAGSLQVADAETGELFDRNEFVDRNGNYIIISRSTVWNVLNKPDNAAVIDSLRSARIDHVTQATPYNRRRKPDYSLSMVSLDDWQHSIRTTEGEKLNAYTAFDVCSEAIIGFAFATHAPDIAMVRECLRSMYSTLSQHGLPWPLEAQVENHLIRDMDTEFRGLFPYLTYCVPGLSRDKHAENLIGLLKKETMKRTLPIGRWHAKHKAYRVKNAAKDEDYKQPRLPKDELIASTIESIATHNHSLHSNQKKYPGKTRWEVLLENVNPNALPLRHHTICRYIGNATETSIRNNDYIRLQYEDYAIESFDMLSLLKPGDYGVTAYWLPSANGDIAEAYLYQGETYLGRAIKYKRYNTAKAERTEEDERIRVEQAKRQRKYFAREKELRGSKVRKVALVTEDHKVDYEEVKVELIPEPEESQQEVWDEGITDDIVKRAINSL